LYYLPVLFLAFLPWSFPLGWGLARVVGRLFHRRAAADPAAEFLAIWLLVPLVFFSLIRTKLPGYILPIFPAAAILTAREWEKNASGRPARRGGFRIACALGAASLPGVALALPFLLQHRYGIPPKQGWIFPLASFTLAALAVGSALAPRGKLRSVWWTAAAALFVLGFVRFAIVPVAPYESMREMTALLLAKREAGFPVALAGGHLKGTFFYTACSVPMPRDINDLLRPEWGPPLFCLVKDRYRLDLEGWARRGGFDLTTVERRGSLSMVEVSR
ncbi:MAG TPA: hypothetical protein VKL61_03070, partial [Candidatus Polarisedimenticolia bacterium]|nr:hypothetical protein [Candidatus Polarisedimenticolia bacterium]